MSARLARTVAGMVVRTMRTMRYMSNQAADTKCCQANQAYQANQAGQVDKIVSELKNVNFGIACLTSIGSANVLLLCLGLNRKA